jgi:diketogulonate reductase-like aldo/keto reductase
MTIPRISGLLLHPATSTFRKASKMSTSALSHPHSLNTPPNTMPKFLYGTAWKKERTADLVYEALKAGFRGVDTAAQPRHYNEKLVGDGIRRAISEGLVDRKDLFVSLTLFICLGRSLEHMRTTVKRCSLDPDEIHTHIRSRPAQPSLRSFPFNP